MYIYETHLHTSLVSACSRFTPEEIVEKYVRLGYAGVFVTDHFLNGNTSVDKSLPYREQIERFCEGYLAVKECAEGTSLDVFFGFEYSYKGTDFLVYGLDGAWLKKHELIMHLSAREFCHYARERGGLVIQAHPFREASYIDHIRLFPSDVDGVEIYNANQPPRVNGLAENLAREYGLIRTAGSDIHTREQTLLGCMGFEKPLESAEDFCERLRAQKGDIFTLVDTAVK